MVRFSASEASAARRRAISNSLLTKKGEAEADEADQIGGGEGRPGGVGVGGEGHA